MRTPVYLTGPVPTAEELAKELGMSPARTKRLTRLAEEIYARSTRPAKKASQKNRVAKAKRLKKR